MKYLQEKTQITEVIHAMYQRGMINFFEGNVSMRVGDAILLTPSQQDKSQLAPEQILELGLDGRVLYAPPGLRPSVEYRMHTAVYGMRPDVRAIVHNHSACATAYAMAGKPMVSDACLELNLLFGQVPIAPYGMLGTTEIYRGLAPLLAEYDAVLLENHGVLTVASDLTTAFARAEAVEKMAKTMILTQLLGGEKPLPAEDLARARQEGAEKRRTARQTAAHE